jgi:hypothetical protein
MAIRLDELENLLNRIWSGELKHDQSDFYSSCGTAACVCGWDYALDKYEGCLAAASPDHKDVWGYSQTKYGLTRAEAWLLFDNHSTKLLQKTTLTSLKEGRSMDADVRLYISSEDYNSPDVSVSADSLHDTERIEKFFEGTPIKVPPCRVIPPIAHPQYIA